MHSNKLLRDQQLLAKMALGNTAERGFDDYDLWAVFQGVGSLIVGKKRFDVESGSCFVLPPNTKIVGTHDPKRPLLVINVHFTLIKDNIPVFPISSLNCYIASQNFFKELLSRVISFYYRDNAYEAIAALRVALNEFLSTVQKGNDSPLPHPHIVCTEDICNCINASPKDASSLSEFAKKYGYSSTYLGKIFHKITGVTFSQYLQNARINQAKLLLRTSTFSVSEISDSLGFCDSGHFIKQFKQRTGISPLSYRNRK